MNKVLLSCYLILSTMLLIAAEPLTIRGEKFANWWSKGESVAFKSKTALSEHEKLTVRVYNASNVEIFKTELSAADFNQNGWIWQAPNPGFYEAEFSIGGKPVAESYKVTINKQDLRDKRKYKRLAEQDFDISRHPFVVAPAKAMAPALISPNFGASLDFGMCKKTIPLSRLIGFNSIRAHMIRWDAIEKERGKIDWRSIDNFMRIAHNNGYKDKDIVFNIFGTPKWASTRPKADWINIFIREYATVIPKDMNDWRNFIRQVIHRYPGVTRYELWNEPHLIGFSCFWADSTANFIKLLKAGYETVKAEKPEATVWLGGIGMRYLPFYEEFLKEGGGKYYDVLPLHGSWVRPEPFHRLEVKYNVEKKPVVSSEWHAMLLKPMMPDYPSEQLLSRNMLLDFLNQIRAGITKVNLFCILNLYRTEKETLPFYRKYNSNVTHVSGLFRHIPYIQPRYPALAWHNFTAQVKGHLKIGDGYFFSNKNSQRAILLESESGTMLIFWNTLDKVAPINPKLFDAIDSSSRVLNPEGVELTISKNFKLDTDVYYIVRDPAMTVINKWTNKGEVLLPHNTKMPLDDVFHGIYRAGRLFDNNMKVIAPEKLAWHKINRTVVLDPKIAQGKVSGAFAVGFSKNFMELIAEVNDPVHWVKTKNMIVWEFDSIQFALDVRRDGFDSSRLEFAAALDEDGKPALWKVTAPSLGGDLPGQYTPAGGRVQYGNCKIERHKGKMIYRIRINASELNPFTLGKHRTVRFSMLINNNDGQGRAAYVEWASGIGGVKDPCKFGNLTVQLSEKNICAQQNLKYKGWNKDYDLEFLNTDGIHSVKVVGKSPLCSGVSTASFSVIPGAAYRVIMEVRGNARFQVLASINHYASRMDLLPSTRLTDKWEKIDLSFIAPVEAENAAITCFAWKQPGCIFEIRNFIVEAR